MSLLELRNLTHVYSRGTPFEKVAIDHLDLDIGAGETLGLIGHTGSGKSTLISHLNALLKPTEGTVLFSGEDIYSSKAAMRHARFRVGVVFQYPEYQLFEETVYADIAYGPKNQRLSQQEIDRRVREAAAFVGLSEDQFNRSPLELSGGQKRRAAIAGVLAMEPEVLVLDEPTAGLDPAGREDLLEKLFAWKDASGGTIILVTHDMSIANRCERLVVLESGRIVLDGPPEIVFAASEQLRGSGLDLPAAAHIAGLLRRAGVDLPAAIYTVDQLADAILSLRGKGGRPC